MHFLLKLGLWSPFLILLNVGFHSLPHFRSQIVVLLHREGTHNSLGQFAKPECFASLSCFDDNMSDVRAFGTVKEINFGI